VEFITPEIAASYLTNNRCNRPISWKLVSEFALLMSRNQWPLTHQGIAFASDRSMIDGQKRCLACIEAKKMNPEFKGFWCRVSRGWDRSLFSRIDRGQMQSEKDLAFRSTGKKATTWEIRVAKFLAALKYGRVPTKDETVEIWVDRADEITSFSCLADRKMLTPESSAEAALWIRLGRKPDGFDWSSRSITGSLRGLSYVPTLLRASRLISR
jgi:hypothetical protein